MHPDSNLLKKHSGLYTDHYELTMAQGYFLYGRQDTRATFDYFFRRNPYKGGFVVFAGLSDLLQMLEELRFDEEDCTYLEQIGFRRDFCDYLRSFKFSGNLYAPKEGEIVFPYVPIIRIEGTIIETQLVESLLLNICNFESLIATKAARIRLVAGKRTFIDFGLRRAQGLGALHASKACTIGGADGTSNVLAAYLFGLTSTGTQAHSWIQSYDDELTAFREFADIFPDRCILLVDTYDTLKNGVPNAITVAKEMETKGHQLWGIRLDSGDLAYISKKARKMLDDAGLAYVKIIASNQLDEYLIKSLKEQQAPIDGFGVGTSLITGRSDAALDGVYKLAVSGGKPSVKLSENLEKVTLPGEKTVYRYFDKDNHFYGDAIALTHEEQPTIMYHPTSSDKHVDLSELHCEPLLHPVMENGQTITDLPTPTEAAAYSQSRLAQLPDWHKRFENPHYYKVGITKELMELRHSLLAEVKGKHLML